MARAEGNARDLGYLWDKRKGRQAYLAAAVPWTRVDWLILLALVVLAAGLRAYGLGRVPPGFQFDEAYNALDAARVMAGDRPLFLPANGGREVVYTYLQAGLASLLGLSVYTLRLTSALAGTATVGACYWLLRTLLRSDSRRLATFTALALAFSFWHLHFSHYGIRVILMPLIFSGLFGCFWLAVRTGRPWLYLISGILAGLSVWTNPTGRLTPFVLAGYVAWVLLTRRGTERDSPGPIPGLLLAGGAAFLVFLPLGLEFYRHPDFFLGHAGDVSVFAERVSGGSPLLALLRHALAVLGMFSLQGDRAWIHNLAGRPVFDPMLSIAFWLGVIIWGARLARSDDPDRDALALLGLWTGVMLLPSVLSDDAPNFSRTLPSLPALFLAVGLGLAKITDLAGQALRQLHRRASAGTEAARGWIALLPAALMLAASLGFATRDYFVRFPAQPEVYYAYDVDKLDAWEQIQGWASESQVYLSQLWAEHATLEFLRRESVVKSLDNSETDVLPPEGQGAVYAFPAEQHDRAVRTAKLWPGTAVTQVPDRYGRPLLEIVKIDAEQVADWPPTLAPEQDLDIKFVGAPSLLGVRAVGSQIELFWQAEEPVERSLTTFVHLVDEKGRRVGQADRLPGNGSYPTTKWTAGERVIERYAPALGTCVGEGPLRILAGWYELGGERTPRADGAGDTALAGEITLPLTSRPPEQAGLPDGHRAHGLADGLVLAAHQIEGEDLQAGAPFTLDLFWSGETAAAERSLTISLAPAGGEAAGSATLWQGPLAPADARWRPGEILCRRLELRLPPDAAAGPYALRAAVGGEAVALGELSLGASKRRFDVPPLSQPIDAALGEALRLRGAKVEVAPKSAITVTLAWQAMMAPDAGYTVFVHLLDQAGRVVTQSDAPPAGGYGTERWVPGEVVVDRHVLDLTGSADAAAGCPCRIVAGMYDPLSGTRLPAMDESGRRLPGDAVPLGEISSP